MIRKSTFCLPVLTMLTFSGVSHAVVLYNSDDDFNVTSTSTMAQIGWVGVYGNASEKGTPTTTTGTYKTAISFGTNGSLNNYLYFQKNNGDTDIDFFAHTDAGSTFTDFAPADYTELSATWLKSSGSNPLTGYHVTVRVGGAWYASTANSNGADGTTNFDFLSSGWVSVDEGGSSLALGSLPALTYADLFADGSAITDFGFYVDDIVSSGNNGSNRTLRIDNIEIIGVPEPSSSLLLLLGLGGGLARRKR